VRGAGSGFLSKYQRVRFPCTPPKPIFDQKGYFMYSQYDSQKHNDQDFVHNIIKSIRIDDPAKATILSKATESLMNGLVPDGQPGLTIGDVCDLTGFKEGFVRDRLSEIIDEGKLGCIPGAGRRPSYYVLFEDISNSQYQKESEVNACEIVLRKVQQHKDKLIQQIQQMSIQLADYEATERCLLQMNRETEQEELDDEF
jgi:hypothetical protein